MTNGKGKHHVEQGERDNEEHQEAKPLQKFGEEKPITGNDAKATEKA